MDYNTFLKTKQKKINPNGYLIKEEDINPILFPFQKKIVKHALRKGRFLIGEDCGLGKTFQQLEWARLLHEKTNGNVLIVAPLGVTKQTAIEEAPKLNIKVNICKSTEDILPGINITNYEMVKNFNGSDFVGVILDESSILKNFTGTTRLVLKDKFKSTPYKLLCSATPAPNEFLELLNQADFLGIQDSSKSLAKFFINDMKTGTWRLKGHATVEFWRWVCSWALIIEKPSDIGFDDKDYILPNLIEKIHVLEIDECNLDIEDGNLFRNIEMSATGFHKEKKRTTEKRVKKCAEIIETSPNEQFIIWCDTNYEADLLKEAISEAIEVRGNHTPKYKEDAIDKFKSGEIRILISKPSIFGYGMNFQKCQRAIFCGLTYSYEDYYQTLKRIYRFGQLKDVIIDIVIGSTELNILQVIREKQQRQNEIKNQMNTSIKSIQVFELEEQKEERQSYKINNIELPKFLS